VFLCVWIVLVLSAVRLRLSSCSCGGIWGVVHFFNDDVVTAVEKAVGVCPVVCVLLPPLAHLWQNFLERFADVEDAEL
jgi:hypothetical protein